MSWTSKSMLGLVFVLIGAIILFSALGIHLGGLVGLIIAICLMAYGFKKLFRSSTSGGRLFGGAMLIFGTLMLIGTLHIIFKLILAAVIIFIGFHFFKKGKRHHDFSSTGSSQSKKDNDPFDEEWHRVMKEH